MPRAIGIGIGTAFGGSVPSAFGDATFWLDAASGLVNLGQGGTALTPTSGSSAGADSNDPLLLQHTGTNYLYLPGVAGNYGSVPDADFTGSGDVTVLVRASVDWKTTSFGAFCGNTNQTSTGIRVFTGNGSKRLGIGWYDSGTSSFRAITANADNPMDANTDSWIKIEFDRDNGSSQCAASFWYATGSASEPSSWTQIGSTVTLATVANIAYSAAAGQGFGIGSQKGDAFQNGLAGSYYQVIVYNDTTKKLDVNLTTGITSGGQTSFTASTGQTVTINRSTSGRKAVAVTRPVWLFGTDDYLEVADNDLLDFGASDSFTVMACGRFWNTQGTDDTLVAKKANTTNTTQGWSLSNGSSTALNGQAQIGDGTAGITATSASRTVGALTMVTMVRNVGSDNVTVYTGSTAGTPVTDTTTTTLANSEVMRIGRLAGAGTEYADMTLVAVAVWRRALTAAEITAITNYYGAA